MNIKTIFTVIVFSIAAAYVSAQTIKTELGALFKNDEREIPVDIIGGDDSGYYLLYSGGRFGLGESSIRKFGKDLTPTGKEIVLDLRKTGTKSNTLGVTKIGNNIVHVWSWTDAESRKYYYQYVNLDDFSLGKPQFITEIKNDDKKSNRALSRFIFSDENQTIRLFYTIPNDKKDNQKIRIQTFDYDFNLKSTDDYEFPFENRYFGINSLQSDNNGDFIMIAVIYPDKKERKANPDIGHEFFIYKLEKGQINTLNTVKPGKLNLRSLDLSFDDSNNMLLAGIYSENDYYAMKGIYFSKIDANTNEFLIKKQHNLSASFITKLLQEGKKKERIKRKVKEGKHEDPYYIHRHTLQQDNGDFLIMAEQIHSYSYNGAITYYHQNLALFNLNPEGELIWSNKIGKNNTKPNVSIYSSYFPVLRDSNLSLLYNCNEKNLNHSAGPAINSFNSGNIFLVNQIDLTSGEYKRKKLVDKNTLEGVTIRPLLYNWIDDNTLLMFGQDIDNLKNQRFVKVIFE